jgi:hypothetical protein
MYTGIPAGFFLLKYGNREYGRETASPVPVPAGFLFFFLFSCFSCKNGTRSANTGFGVGRYGIFPFPLSSLPPTLAPTVFQPKKSSRCHHRRNPRRTFQERQIEMTTILLKGMQSSSSLNLLTPQIKSGEQSSKL